MQLIYKVKIQNLIYFNHIIILIVIMTSLFVKLLNNIIIKLLFYNKNLFLKSKNNYNFYFSNEENQIFFLSD